MRTTTREKIDLLFALASPFIGLYLYWLRWVR